MEYMSCPEAAEKWGISERRVQILCKENLNTWCFKNRLYVVDTQERSKPFDKRIKRSVDNE